MQTSGYWDTLIEVSGATRLLNNEAYQIFTTAIPGIAEAVPSLFFMTDTARTYTAATTDEAFLNSLKENAETSHGEAFWRPIKEAANVLGVDTAVTATGAWIILWLVVAMIIWLAMRDILIAATISLIVPLIGVQFGGINGTYLAIAIAVLAMGWGYNLWLRKT